MKRSRLKPRSDKRIAEDDAYLEVRMQVNVRDMGRCQARSAVPHLRCAGQNDPHHVHPIGSGGPRLELTNIITVCRVHHDWIHLNAFAAGLLGLFAGGRAGTYQQAAMIRKAAQ